jgi:transitional endoplasmic reticulum ATPase
METAFDCQTHTGVSFDNLGGLTDVKQKLRTEVITPLENPERAKDLGVSPPGVILYGPPGVGKTYSIKALATELGLPFVQVSGADIQSKWINESTAKVNTLLSEAQKMAAQEGGAVVFIDEIDSVLKSRSGSENAHEEESKSSASSSITWRTRLRAISCSSAQPTVQKRWTELASGQGALI